MKLKKKQADANFSMPLLLALAFALLLAIMALSNDSAKNAELSPEEETTWQLKLGEKKEIGGVTFQFLNYTPCRGNVAGNIILTANAKNEFVSADFWMDIAEIKVGNKSFAIALSGANGIRGRNYLVYNCVVNSAKLDLIQFAEFSISRI